MHTISRRTRRQPFPDRLVDAVNVGVDSEIGSIYRILASEALVNINAAQGAVVSPMTGEDVIELYVMREVLEGLASRSGLIRGRRPL